MERDTKKESPEVSALELMGILEKLRSQKDEDERNQTMAEAKKILSRIQGTRSFKVHLYSDLNLVVKTGIIDISGYDFFLKECGIDIGEGKYGVFDRKRVRMIERAALIANAPNPYLTPQFTDKHKKKIDEWKADFDRTYQEKIGNNN